MPIKTPIHMKAICRQQRLFKSIPPCQPSVCSSAGVRQCVWSPYLPLERPVCLWCQPTTPACHSQVCQYARPALPACVSASQRNPHWGHCHPASCGANEKSLWQLSWLAWLPEQASLLNRGHQSATYHLFVDRSSHASSQMQNHDLQKLGLIKHWTE